MLDSDVRAYLAERWSRSQPKEAALDYTTDGEWRDPREEVPRHGRAVDGRRQAQRRPRRRVRRRTTTRSCASPGEIRHAVNGWRHGSAVDAFAAERGEVLAAWDELRARTREEGDAVALSPAFRETLDRHGALMKQAASFTARPRTFERLLADRAGIGQGEMKEFGDVYARAGSYRRAAAARAAHARQPEPSQEAQEVSRAEEPVETVSRSREAVRAEEPVKTAPRPPERPAKAPQAGEAGLPAVSRTEYRNLRLDWTRHVGRAERAGVSPYELDGAADLVRRIAAFAENERVPEEPRQRLQAMVDRYRAHVRARTRVQNWLDAAEEHWRGFDDLARKARSLGVRPERLPAWPDWLESNERLVREGRAILDKPGTHGVPLDRMKGSRGTLRETVSRMERFTRQHRTRSHGRDRGPSWSM